MVYETSGQRCSGALDKEKSKVCTHIFSCLDGGKLDEFIASKRDHNFSGCKLCADGADVEVLYLCLTCFAVHCGRNDFAHALQHYNETKHALVLGVWSLEVWCYECDEYLFSPASNVSLIPRDKRALKSARLKFARLFRDTKDCPDAADALLPVFSSSIQLSDAIKEKQSPCALSGLVNLGNTCFFNSTLQCLLNSYTIQNSINERGIDSLARLGPVWNGFTSVLAASLAHRPRIVPDKLFEALSRRYYSYRPMRQQDSHELLRRLLDTMTEEENGRNECLVNDWFRGQLANVLVCAECGEVSNTVEPFYDLSLSIVPMNKGKTNAVDPHQSLEKTLSGAPYLEQPEVRARAKRSQHPYKLRNRSLLKYHWRDSSSVQGISSKLEAVSRSANHNSSSPIVRSLPKPTYGSNSASCTETESEDGSCASDLDWQSAYQERACKANELLADRRLARQESALANLKLPKTTTLSHCLEAFMDVEVLEGDNGRVCENCRNVASGIQVPGRTFKRYLFHQLPKILVLHLKRFCHRPTIGPNGLYRMGRMTKLDQSILFDETIDMAPLMIPCEKLQDKSLEDNHVFQMDTDDPSCNTVYKLTGVVQHYGTLSAGHYSAFVRHKELDSWFYASDTKTRPALWEEVVQAPAYLLFYEQVVDKNKTLLPK